MRLTRELVQFYIYELGMRDIVKDCGWRMIKHGMDTYPRIHENQGETSRMPYATR
jgi:hypothetical protein